MNSIAPSAEAAAELKRARRGRGYRFFITRGLLALAVALAALPLLGLGYETFMAAADARQFPPQGRLVDVGGHQMHLSCTGSGSPTVVMDAGLGGWSLDWSAVQPQIARSTRVCSYDRAGLGWSEPGEAPGHAQQAVDDLHALLANGGEHGPFVLVGHSNGGLRALLYAQAYPREVGGLVLVDPTPLASNAERIAFLAPPEQAEYLALVQALNPKPDDGDLGFFGLMQTLRPFGVPRLLIDTLLQGSSYHYVSPALQPAYRFGMNQSARLATTLAETVQRQATIDRARAVGSLGDMPLAVLSSTKLTAFYRDPLPANLPPRLVELIQKTAWEAKADMARLSSNSTIIPVERSGHFIQFDRPDAVVQAVQTVVAAIQHP